MFSHVLTEDVCSSDSDDEMHKRTSWYFCCRWEVCLPDRWRSRCWVRLFWQWYICRHGQFHFRELSFFSCVFFILVLRLPGLGKRELILVLFVRLLGLYLFRFVGFHFLLGSGKGFGLWLWHSLDFSLTFLTDKLTDLSWIYFVFEGSTRTFVFTVCYLVIRTLLIDQITWVLLFQRMWIVVSMSRIFLPELQGILVVSAWTVHWHLKKSRMLHTKCLCLPSWSRQPQFLTPYTEALTCQIEKVRLTAVR